MATLVRIDIKLATYNAMKINVQNRIFPTAAHTYIEYINLADEKAEAFIGIKAHPTEKNRPLHNCD